MPAGVNDADRIPSVAVPAGVETPLPPHPEPGARIRILLPSNDDEGLLARVIRVEGERVWVRMSPRDARAWSPAAGGGECQLVLGRFDSAYLFRAMIVSAPGDGTIELLLCGHPLRLQRREYFRLAVRMPLVVRVPTETPVEDAVSGPEEPPPPAEEVRIFQLADLSGGGCLCLDPDSLLQRGRLYPAGLDLSDGKPALQLRVEVVRRGISFGCPSAGLRYVALVEKHRERIMRTLFREYRRRAGTTDR